MSHLREGGGRCGQSECDGELHGQVACVGLERWEGDLLKLCCLLLSHGPTKGWPFFDRARWWGVAFSRRAYPSSSTRKSLGELRTKTLLYI